MKRNARPSLFDPIPFDDPLEMLLACHRRIEKHLETLKRLRAHVEAHGVDVEASAAAHNLLGYFLKAAMNHHEDEEKDLFPMLERRIDDAGERARFVAFREELERDHRDIETLWARLRKPLEGIAEGLTRALPASDVHAFVGAYARHILAEESALTEFCDRWLEEGDRRALGHAMSARRMENRDQNPMS